MGHVTYLFAALALIWLGIFLYLWMLRRSVQRLTDELEALRQERTETGGAAAGEAGAPYE